MSAFPTDILIAKFGGRDSLDQTAHKAKVLLVKKSRKAHTQNIGRMW